MITDFVQRFTEGRESRRPAGELIRPAEYDVVEFPDDARPRAFVERHHYSGSWCAARFRFGLYYLGDLAGVAVFSVGASGAAHRKVWPTLDPYEAVDLGRFVLVDSVPGNGESWFIARCFALLAGRVTRRPARCSTGRLSSPRCLGSGARDLRRAASRARTRAMHLRMMPVRASGTR